MISITIKNRFITTKTSGMLVLAISLTLLYLSFNNGDPMFSNIHHTLFGNLASIKDLFINDTDEADLSVSSSANDADTDEPLDMEFPNVFQFRTNLSGRSFDIQDYNLVNENYMNTTKIYKMNNTRRFSYHDYDDLANGERIEDYKRNLLSNILIQFVMHARYEVGKALTQRDALRSDKRYQLGYLFNRLRRLKTEQLKMVVVAWKQNGTSYRSMLPMMRLYERVVHLDVDMRDTCKLIKEVYSKNASYDYYNVTTMWQAVTTK